jgi:VanZ family protein
MKRKQIWILFAVLCFLVDSVLLLIPGSSLPSQNWWTNIPMFDKWVHIILFTPLSFFSYQVLMDVSITPVLDTKLLTRIGIACLLYGILIEVIQHFFIPMRSFDIGDILADGIGVVIGLYLVYVYKKIDPCKNRGRNQN